MTTTKTTVIRQAFEASELGWPPGWHEDAIWLTGIWYRYDHAEKDAEGDTQAWIYKAHPSGDTVTVFND